MPVDLYFVVAPPRARPGRLIAHLFSDFHLDYASSPQAALPMRLRRKAEHFQFFSLLLRLCLCPLFFHLHLHSCRSVLKIPNMDGYCSSPSGDLLKAKPSCDLLRLPTELRLQIFEHLLPRPLPSNIIHARYGGLRWLSASRHIFADVAPSFYGRACFTTYTGGERGSLFGYFENHLRLTYGEEPLPWILADACSMVKHIGVDFVVPRLHDPTKVIESFQSYFDDIKRFHNLQTLRIRFHRDWRYPLQPPSEGDQRFAFSSTLRDPHLGSVLQDSLDRLVLSLTEPCELSVSEHGNWDVDQANDPSTSRDWHGRRTYFTLPPPWAPRPGRTGQ